MEKRSNQKIRNDKNLQLKIFFLKYYKLIILFFVATIIGLSYYFILNPKYQQASIGGKYNVSSLQQELDRRSAYLADLKSLDNNYKLINQKDIEKIKMILPEEKDIAGIFVQLESLAKENNLFLDGVSINEAETENIDSAEKNNDGIKKLSIKLNLTSTTEDGDYNEIKNFLSSLEYNLRLFDVNAVYFSPGSPTYSINLFTYYYKK